MIRPAPGKPSNSRSLLTTAEECCPACPVFKGSGGAIAAGARFFPHINEAAQRVVGNVDAPEARVTHPVVDEAVDQRGRHQMFSDDRMRQPAGDGQQAHSSKPRVFFKPAPGPPQINRERIITPGQQPPGETS
jgi:hypothetical protein